MRLDAYRKRLTADLDRWIAAGLVAQERRAEILASVSAEADRDRARIALAVAGAILLGLAVIAFIAANWDGLSRLWRFAVLLTAFGAALTGAVLATARQKPRMADALVLLATMIYAASIGLLGQIFNISGSAAPALMSAAIGALALAAAGASRGAACAALILGALWQWSALWQGQGDWSGETISTWRLADLGYPILVALAGGLSRQWDSAVVRHLAIWGAGFAGGVILFKVFGEHADGVKLWALVQTAVWLSLAAYGRLRLTRSAAGGSTLYGYGVWWGLAAFTLLGLALSVDAEWGGVPVGVPGAVTHRLFLMGGAIGAVALGSRERQGWVTAAGVAAFIAGAAMLLFDLGLSLQAASGVFLLASLAAILGAIWLGRRRRAAGARP
jgi:uncharacterized membrane protein